MFTLLYRALGLAYAARALSLALAGHPFALLSRLLFRGLGQAARREQFTSRRRRGP
jgi:hypothetical protein